MRRVGGHTGRFLGGGGLYGGCLAGLFLQSGHGPAGRACDSVVAGVLAAVLAGVIVVALAAVLAVPHVRLWWVVMVLLSPSSQRGGADHLGVGGREDQGDRDKEAEYVDELHVGARESPGEGVHTVVSTIEPNHIPISVCHMV